METHPERWTFDSRHGAQLSNGQQTKGFQENWLQWAAF